MQNHNTRLEPKIINKLENEICKIGRLKKFDKWYIINGSIKDFINKKTLVLLPYCLKIASCNYRTQSNCDFSQDICKSCGFRKVHEFFTSLGLSPCTIINDDRDVPKAIKNFEMMNGKFKAVVGVACPRAILEYDIKFIKKYAVPILLFLIDGWEECEPKKAVKGKFWGETKIDMKKLEGAYRNVLVDS